MGARMIAIVDYGMGNLCSVKNMLKYLGYDSEVTGEVSRIEAADKLILPGVGNFGKAMEVIRQSGLLEVLNRRVLKDKTPILGICLGMQLLLGHSEEGDCDGLGWIPGEVKRFDLSAYPGLKVPHMGWDYIEKQKQSPLFAGMAGGERYYFVHSYYVSCRDRSDVAATTEYGISFDSMVQRENIYGTQFHPEKSHRFGMEILGNFAKIE